MARLLPLIAVLAALLVAGLGIEPARVFAQQDKVHHLLGFFAFAAALRWARPTLGLGQLMAVSLALAVGIELGQMWLPGRTPSAADVVAGMAGALLGWGAWQVAGRWGARSA